MNGVYKIFNKDMELVPHMVDIFKGNHKIGFNALIDSREVEEMVSVDEDHGFSLNNEFIEVIDKKRFQ